MRPSQNELVRRRNGKKPGRSALVWMLLGSVLLHLLAFAYLSTRPPPLPVKVSRPMELVEIDVQPQRPVPPRNPTKPPPPRPQTQTATKPPPPLPPPTARTEKPPPSTETAPPPPASGGTPGRTETAQGTPPPVRAPLVLTPSLHALPGTEGIPVPSEGQIGGSTIRPDDPSLSPTVRREQERKRVHDRVQDFLETDLGEARAQRGLAHPYLASFRESLLGELGRHGAPTPQQLGFNGLKNMVNNYLSTASQYESSALMA